MGIMSLMDTMATNKLNTFHWHISDAASFPMYSQRQPQMTYYGAYSPRKVYYPQDIREIVEYANQRGIRVIPELDAPAHAGAGWNLGRNYYPKEEIMSLMDTMATNKLNTFHWHISDAASFPMFSQRQPQMTLYGAYS